MKKFLALSLIFLFAFIAMMIITIVVGAENISINNIIDYNYSKIIDLLSDGIMYLSILSGVFIFVHAFVQLIKNKSLKKVDVRFYIYFGLLFFLLILWILFDKVLVLSTRPIDPSEPSFPSTHILLVTYTTLSFAYLLNKIHVKKDLKIISYIVASTLVLSVTFGRIFSGMHYITDSLAGILIGLAAFFLLIYLSDKFIDEKSLKNDYIIV